VFELIKVIIIASIGFLFVGYTTPKITLYGGIATLGVTFAYLLIPTFSASSVVDTMLPLWIDFWLLYPTLMQDMLTAGQATGSWYGTIINGIVIVSLGFPYLIGIYFGIATYPEFYPLRWFL